MLFRDDYLKKMKVYAYISIVEAVLKLLLVLLLAVIDWDKLILYGFLIVTFNMFVCYYVFSTVQRYGDFRTPTIPSTCHSAYRIFGICLGMRI